MPGLAEVAKAPTVVAPRGQTHTIRGVKVHETRLLRPDDIRTVDGLPVTSPARTLIDMAAELHLDRLFRLIDESAQARCLDFDDLALEWANITKQGRPGRRLIEGYLRGRTGPPPHPISELEYRFDRAIARAGMAEPHKEFRPPWYDGVSGIVDRAWPEARLIVELDGRSFHSTLKGVRNDHRRDRVAQSHGWHVFRYIWVEVTRHSDNMIQEISGRLAQSLSA